jgi:serine/threonine-protein kinase RIO1
MRDILIMERLADEKGISAPIIKSIRESNEGK